MRGQESSESLDPGTYQLLGVLEGLAALVGQVGVELGQEALDFI